MKKIVIVLGAGASKPAGYPLYSELLSLGYINKLDQQQKIKANSCLTGQITYLRKMAEILGSWGHSFEEIMEKMLRTDQKVFNDLMGYYQTLMLIAEQMQPSCEGEWPPIPYLNFAAILKVLLKKGHKITIISFNHDLLIENILLWKDFTYDPRGRNCYGIPSGCTWLDLDNGKSYVVFNATVPEEAHDFSGWQRAILLSAPTPPKGDNLIHLLKLHGSFNQLVCDKCSSIFFGYGVLTGPQIIEPLGPLTCHLCKVPLSNSIRPPMQSKKANKIAFEESARALEKADEINFVGYSLPEYDKEALILFAGCSKSAQVTVYNKSTEEKMARRFFKLLPQAVILPMGFEHFVYDLSGNL